MHSDTLLLWLLVLFLFSFFYITIFVPNHYSKEDLEFEHKFDKKNNVRVPGKFKYVALFCLERSGSTWLEFNVYINLIYKDEFRLTAMLNNNLKVNILAEPLVTLAGKKISNDNNDIYRQIDEEILLFSSSIKSIENNDMDIIGFNEKLFYPKYQTPHSNYGRQKLKRFLEEKRFRIVLLLRKNFVYQAVSMIRAVQLASDSKCSHHGWSKVNQSGWNDLCGSSLEALNKQPLRMDTLKENLDEVKRKTEAMLHMIASLGIAHLTIYYEDMQQDPQMVMDQFCQWVGCVTPLRARTTLYVKQGSESLADMLPNSHEVKRFLQETYGDCIADQVDRFNPALSCI